MSGPIETLRPFGEQLLGPVLYSEHDGQAWQPPQTRQLQDLAMPLAGPALQYGLSVFEGLKAYRASDDTVHLFRPADHARRLHASARRLGLPPPPEALFLEMCAGLAWTLRHTIPAPGRGALYLRPTLFALDATLGLRPASRHGFAVIANPCLDPPWRSIRLWAEPELIRAAAGGLGAVKTAANYAAGLAGLVRARERGFDDVLWLDAAEHRWLAEAGSMNVFAEIDGTLVTPALDGTLLAGVTRAHLLERAAAPGLAVVERAVSLDELARAARQGRLGSVFGTGTAARLVSIRQIGGADGVIEAGDDATARRLHALLRQDQERISDVGAPWSMRVRP